MIHEWRRGEYLISTDRSKLDLARIHGFLTQSYWAEGIPIDIVQRSLEHSLPFGVYHAAQQVGFARIVSDYATFAYVGDVFILDEHRGQGLSKWLMQVVAEHPDLQGLRMWLLATRDAHGLYALAGFVPLSAPERFMVKRDPDVYKRG
jgi:GNAT superfamily N-acetyltransferase